MVKVSYYVDTCIWLNLFKKEGDSTKGIPYWKIAEDFIDKVRVLDNKEIVFSGFVLKEMKFKLKNSYFFQEKESFLNKNFKFIKSQEQDRSLARKLESQFEYELSFYDCFHIAICKRLSLILITRDNTLIKLSQKYIDVKKPEELFI